MGHMEKKLFSELIHQGKIITIRFDTVLLEDGKLTGREVIGHPGGVGVLAIDEQDRVLFVRQFRYAYDREILELPAGKLEKGEDPAQCGMRELEEECGYTAGVFLPLGVAYPSPGILDEVLHLYVAKQLTKTGQNLDEGEFLTVERIPYNEAVNRCISGEIQDAKTLVAILKYNEMSRRGLC